MCNQQVCALDDFQQISKAVAHSWEYHVLHQKAWARLRLHDLLNELCVLCLGDGNVGTHGAKTKASLLNLLAVITHRGNHGLMSALLQLKRKRHVRMDVAKGAECAENDFLAFRHRLPASLCFQRKSQMVNQPSN